VARGAGPRWRPSAWMAPVAAVVTIGAVTAAAIASPGYDAQETPRLETGVWVTRDDGQYARVNTELGEIDTTRAVAQPGGLVQSGSRGLVFTQGFVQAWPLDGAHPTDLISGGQGDASSASAATRVMATPNGTSHVSSAGPYVLYLTTAGRVYVGTLPDGESKPADPRELNPVAEAVAEQGAERPRYVAEAAAIDADGNVAMFSTAEGGVRRFSTSTGKFVGSIVTVPRAPDPGAELSMTMVDGHWVLFSASTSTMWIEGLEQGIAIDVAGDALLQTGSMAGDSVLIADSTGLVKVGLNGSTVTRIADSRGTPAAPVVVNGTSYAAWITTTSASMWSSDTGDVRSLDVDAQALQRQLSLSPVFRSNGDRAVLSETVTGLLWTVPDGKLIALSEWRDLESSSPNEGTIQVDDVIEQKPPVAKPDVFGVRRGAVVALPVLLNDDDPNKKDVLTIDSASMTDLSDPGFGSLSLVTQDQQAVVHVRATDGSATFTYAATDGIADSPPTTVTLTVVPDDVNTAPEWCPVEGCTQLWTTPQVAPGGFVSVPVLDGWVDAEGDALLLIDARADDPNSPVSVVPTADGRVAIRHLDPNAGEATIPVTITVADARGLETTKDLDVRVTSTPSLVVKPVAVSGAVSTPVKVPIADHVAGGSGSYRLVDSTAAQGRGDTFTVSPSSANGTIELVATEPGRFTATYTVEDTESLAQRTAVIRLTVADPTQTLALPPLTSFVRAGEDTTVDVLAATNATTGRVLMVSSASTSDSALSVNVVGGATVRVRATSTSALPGRLGVADVTITDGAGNTATTQLTVFLLPASHGVGPIAAPDTVSVRAGTQVDMPVLANDVSPRGERIVLHPQIEGSGALGELAFASGSKVRYLAPQVPGVYVLHYSAFLEGDPGRLDVTTLTVTVLPAGSNRAPQPPVLAARVLAGHSVTIPLKLNRIDPDGDPVTLADVGQPAEGLGVVSISAQGDAIVYRAPEGGVPGGQLSFDYTVRDLDGAEAIGTVNVGVLDAEGADVAPVTYADYVSARLGSRGLVTVQPLLNDRDPLQGRLEIIRLVPNADPSSPEYARLESLVDPTTSLPGGMVVLHPGDVEGPHSYTYTVQSDASFSTAEGLIVIGVSDAPSPESLTVTDTVITAKSRSDLAGGIDVVTGKVQWPTGDLSTLKLALWGKSAQGFTTSGWSIAGALPRERAVIPFSLTGQDSQREQITTYGFLRIPSLDEMRLQAKPGLAPIQVAEEASVTIDLMKAVDIGPRDAIEIRQDASFAVQRGNATCAPSSATTVSYTAGREAPWRDTCSVAVRLVGQDTWSIVPVPIVILPKDPQAILTPASRTITPGQKDSIDVLRDLVSWEGGRVGSTNDLNFAIAFSGPSFEVSQAGSTVSIQAKATARPGTRETITVSTSAYGGLATTITLVVGSALDQLPKGANFGFSCDVSRSASCLITSVGLPSEFDPYAGAPGAGLHLDSVGTNGSVVCAAATVTIASDTQLVATWPSGQRPAGGECIADFIVTDAQGGKGPGQVRIDILGYPQTPASITTVAYTGTSVTLAVSLGQATQAHPAVTAVKLYEGGVAVTAECQPAGPGTYRCLVSGLVNGDKHTYTARAVNSIGESLDTTTVTSWAYQAPEITAISASTVYDSVRTTQAQGVVTVTVDGPDDIDHFVVDNNGTTIARTGASSQGNTTIPVGNQIVSVTPVSRFQPPISGDNRGASATVAVVVEGTAYYSGGASAPENGTSVTISSPPLQANYSTSTLHELWMAWTVGTPTCTMTGTGGVAVSGGDVVTSTGSTINGLAPNTTYHVSVCGTNGFGAAMASTGDVFTWVPPAPPPGAITFSVDADGAGGDTSKTYGLSAQPIVAQLPGYQVVYWYGGAQGNGTLSLDPGVVQTITATYCLDADTARCSDPTPVTPSAGMPPTTVGVSVIGTCTDDPQAMHVNVSAPAASAVAVTTASTWPSATYTITWSGPFAALNTTTLTRPMCTDPTPPIVPPGP